MNELKLIALYSYLCEVYDNELTCHYQRFSNNSVLHFSDVECLAIYLFAIMEEEKFKIKSIHQYAHRYLQSWYISSETQDSKESMQTPGKAFKAAEYAYNRAKVLQLLSEESRSKEVFELIARSLQVKGVPLAQYLETSATEEEKIIEIQNAIIQFVEQTLNEKLYATSN